MNLSYQKSLEQDQQKEFQKQMQEKQEKQLVSEALNLQEKRKSRVPPEPSLDEAHVVISVRHPNPDFGTVRRIFPSKYSCNSIYDWVGSISSKPMYYRIYFGRDDLVKPWMSVETYERCVLNVAESDTPIELEEDNEITCDGFRQVDDIYSCADEEIDNFLTANSNLKNTDCPVSLVSNVDCNCNKKDTLRQMLIERDANEANRSIICHRRPSAFWRILFQQNLDAGIRFRIIWAGEAGVDDGGPYREFLLNCMQNWPHLSGLFFGSSNKLLFASLTDAVIAKQYRLLGQLSALSIFTVGRGPHCLHPAVVDYMFSGSSNRNFDNVDSPELDSKLDAIEKGENNILIDADIVPTNDKERNKNSFKEYFCVISRAAGIEQFKQGVGSIIDTGQTVLHERILYCR